MGSGKAIAIGAGMAMILTVGDARAADVPYEMPELEPLPMVEVGGGLYLRGYIGMTNQRLKRLDFIELTESDNTFEFLDKGGFDSGPLFGAGIGYAFNEWFRMDVTGEYRGKTHFSALDRVDLADPDNPDVIWDQTNEYSAKKSEWLMLLNAYVDLGTWHGITPYVGAGIGASRNTISHFRDINTPAGAVWYADSHSKWNFAWAAHAGVGYQVTDQLTLDLAYRYVDLGDARTGTNYDALGDSEDLTPVHFKGLTSHDLMLGLRWNFGHADYYPPIVSKY